MTEEIMTTGEKFYCLIQDIEEYIQHNSLEQDKELDFILSQSEELQSDYARLEQENKELSFAIEKCLENAGIECDDEEQALRSLPTLGNAHYKVLVEKEELEQENRELKEEIQFHNKENSNLLAERNAAQIGYDEIREVRERYRSVLVEIREIFNKECGIISNAKVVGIINEVLSV